MRTSTKILTIAIASYIIANFFDIFPLFITSYVLGTIALFLMSRK